MYTTVEWFLLLKQNLKLKLKLNGNDDKHTVQRVERNQKVVFIFEEKMEYNVNES